MHDSFVQHVRQQVAVYGNTRSYTYLREHGRDLEAEIAGYRDLDTDARALAVWLAAQPASTRPVVLLYADAMAFLRAFLGCLYAGVIAVPAPVPHDDRSARRVAGVIADCGAGLVLTTADLEPLIAPAVPSVVAAATDAALADPDAWRMPDIDRDTIAFLQYTSGSTGTPKGVVVTHGNLLHNEAAIADLGIDDTATAVSWIPHFHDMGLIGMLLGAIHTGANLVFMAPTTFLKRPVRWLQAIDRYRATITAAPNFAYELISRRVTDEQVAALDLSSLEIALCGAEPVRARTMAAVRQRFAPAGWRATAFRPAYGLAEVTLLASAARTPSVPGSFHTSTDAPLVGCGRPARGLDIRIVDPDTRQPVPDTVVGEIWIRGASVAAGYWHRPAETREDFGAYLGADGPFLRTGDLGLIRDGELFVAGRRKDLLIVNGRNIYPQDIEELVRGLHPALAGTGVAVSVDAGDRERLVVVHSVKTALQGGASLSELSSVIKAAVAREFAVPAPNVVLVEPRSVHRTTSGKVQRGSMRTALLHRRVDGVLHQDLEPAPSR
ncbi:fatty acyl-AMP ligase [Nocardia cyriacigeorgica]|uniref:fatty acyl-AMP ligase n=1 Tax=Nocardia cyriacigeorgica TaxID=135487 RepID=UPI001892DC75|nr:fatty acyl-AMP ligase [Nocardia cyriacigeorgica]MBF6088663.1 fatty acyl-AMP ligase [Nocardia cyriacigeorgica]MBF6093256.1 fatty acyl-AMP ligase [Nocardia cyriacigeorgica]MBF6346114.1 fatty acyl-AMP ligase [Nocardia cyriacigeorgica]MBF6398745.1 fatty acyl-AMP ligase [Nocardia cyriacigeorgica]MBF6403741.1 fatty acyl-AMP ligase [Nocardia cyriacigeorgica]